jgi:hypothetical protein
MLAELRKFGGTFALATQALAHLDALDPTLRPTVLANVDALYVFATSAEDARSLVHELDDAMEIADVINQDDFTCYAKLALDGRRLPPFTLALDPPPTGDPVLAEQIRGRARSRYGRPIQAVEDDLAQAARRYQPATAREAPPGAPRSPGAAYSVNQSAETDTADAGLRQPPPGRGRYGQRRRGPRATSSAPMDELWAGVFATAGSSPSAPSALEVASGELRSAAAPEQQPRSDVSGAASGKSGIPLNDDLPANGSATDGAEPRAASGAVRREDASTATGARWESSPAFDAEGNEQAWDEWSQKENG